MSYPVLLLISFIILVYINHRFFTYLLIRCSDQMNYVKTPFELETSIVSTQCVGSQNSRCLMAKDDRALIDISYKEPENENLDEIRAKPHGREFSQSNVLTKEELNNFRTLLCNDHINSKCPDPESCFNSHCTAWQRRNPTKYKYSSTICPDIDFSRKGAKGRMSLNCRCRKGKYCEFAHTKEEELYHPDAYKTKKCNAFPNCKRFYCPFIHDCEASSLNSAKNNLKSEDKITHVIPKDEISTDVSRMTEKFYPDPQYQMQGAVNTNISGLKQELLIKLVYCQKFVLEEKYSYAQNIAEDFISLLASLCKGYFIPRNTPQSLNSSITNHHNEFLNPEKMVDHLNNHHMRNAFHFSFDFKNFFDEELKDIIY